MEATPQQGSESWGSFTQKEHDEMSYGEASMCEGAWSVQGAKERPPRLEKTKGAGSERGGGMRGMRVRGKLSDCFTQGNGTADFT